MKFTLGRYIALVCYLKDDVERNPPPKKRQNAWQHFLVPDDRSQKYARDLRSETCNSFKAECAEYLHRVRQYGDAMGITSDYPSYLYNPVCWLGFGKTDQIGLVLLDSFDPMFQISAGLKPTIERISMSFVPKLNELDIPETHLKYHVELSDLLASGNNQVIRDCDATNSSKIKCPVYKSHPFETHTPLVAVSRFKIGTLASLGQGMLMQRALYQAVAARVAATLDELRSEPRHSRFEYTEDDFSTSTDKRGFWYSLLNPQGFDELGLIIGCRNYSIAAAVIAAIRSLTMADIYACGHATKATALRRARIEVELARLSPILERQQRSREEDKGDSNRKQGIDIGGYFQALLNRDDYPLGLSRNHVFMSAHTTLGASHEMFWSNDTKNTARGFVSVNTHFQVHPGHEDVIALAWARNAIRQESRIDPLVDSRKLGDYNDTMILDMGQHDMSCKLADPKSIEVLDIRGIKTVDFLRETRKFFEYQLSLMEIQGYELGIRSGTCAIAVPFPRLSFHGTPNLYDQSSADTFADNIDHAIKAKEEYYEGHLPAVAALRALRTAAEEHFEIESLNNKMRSAGIPRNLRLAVRYLFQDFFLNIGDPATLDGVLDLYDAFATFYYILHDAIPARAREIGSDGRDIFVLKDVVDAFQNALSHRIAANHGFHELHDMSIDWRGGMNQLTEAADLPLKCILGLVKLWAIKKNRQPLEYWYERVAAITAIKLTPSATCMRSLFTGEPLSLGQRNPSAVDRTSIWHSLSVLHVNVSHVFNPLLYLAYFHEGAHVLADVDIEHRRALLEYVNRQAHLAETHGMQALKLQWETVLERHDEQFANAIVLLFVFNSDIALFLRVMYSQFGMSIPPNQETRVRTKRVVEFAIRMFFVVDPVRFPDQWKRESSLSKVPSYEQRRNIEKRFVSDVHVYRKFISGEDARSEEDVRDLEFCCRWQFESALLESWGFAIDECEYSKSIYDYYVSQSSLGVWRISQSAAPGEEAGNALRKQRERIHDAVKNCIRMGNAMVGEVIREVSGVSFGDSKYCELIIVCEMLRAYAALVFGPNEIYDDRRVHVPRNEDRDGAIDFHSSATRDTRWNRFLIDGGVNGIFCADPEARQEFLVWQAVVIKKFWDMSTTLRGRRFGWLGSRGSSKRMG